MTKFEAYSSKKPKQTIDYGADRIDMSKALRIGKLPKKFHDEIALISGQPSVFYTAQADVKCDVGVLDPE